MTKKIIFFLLLASTAAPFSYADKIILKNGEQIEGEILESADDYIKINFSGVPLTYWRDDIERVEGEGTAGNAAAQPGSDTGGRIPPEEGGGQVFSRAAKATVVVHARFSEGRNDGSGFIIDPGGAIAANFHLIAGANEIEVIFKDGTRHVAAGIAGYSVEEDICILKIDAVDLPAISLDDYHWLKRGQKIIAVGAGRGVDHTVADGVYSGRSYEADGRASLKFSAPISPGDSGGLLLDEQGKAIGLIICRHEQKQVNNYAVPVTQIKKLAARSTFIPMQEFVEKVNPAYELYKKAVAAATSERGRVIDYLKQAVYSVPSLTAAYKLMAETYTDDGIPDEAVVQWKTILELDPFYSYAHAQISQRYYERGDKLGAIAYARKALEDSPGDPVLLDNLGGLYAQNGELDKARALAGQVVEKDPEWPAARYNLGYIYQDQGAFAEAIGEYKKAIEFDPGYLQPYVALIWLYLEQKQPALAVRYYQEGKRVGVYAGAITDEKIKPYLSNAKDKSFASFATEKEYNKAYDSLNVKSRTQMDLFMRAVKKCDMPNAVKYILQALTDADWGNVAGHQVISQAAVMIAVDYAAAYYKRGSNDMAVYYYLKALPVAQNFKTNDWFTLKLINIYYYLCLALLKKIDITYEDVYRVEGYIGNLAALRDPAARGKIAELVKKSKEVKEEIFIRTGVIPPDLLAD